MIIFMAFGLTLGVVWYQFNEIQKEFQVVKTITELKWRVAQLTQAGNELIVTEGSSASFKLADVSLKKINELQKELDMLQKETQGHKVIDTQWPEIEKLFSSFLLIKGISSSNDDAMIALGKIAEKVNVFAQNLEKFTQIIEKKAEEKKKKAIIEAVAIVGCLMGIVFIILYKLSGLIVTFVKDLRVILYKMTTGDLSSNLDKSIYKGEFGQIMNDLTNMITTLSEMVSGIQKSAHQIGDMAIQIADTSDHISEATAKQSSDTSAVSAAMEQTTASIISVSDGIDAVKRQANNTMAVLETGINAQQTAAHSIHLFIQQAKQIEAMTEVIKGIAFQTNILALNAAVEAARAGEQGRGFAVVASEVRGLAQKSSVSALEIGKIISAIESSIQLVDKASAEVTTILSKVSMNVRETNSNVNDITNAIAEQKQASQSISINIEAIAAMTDKASSTIHASSEDTRRLQGFSEHLISLVVRFHT